MRPSKLPSASLLGLLVFAGACDMSSQATSVSQQGASSVQPGSSTMNLSSTAFKHGSMIPLKYTGAGDDWSPPLAWSEVPANTQSFAIICDDPDAPSRAKPRTAGPWVHWVIYNIPADLRQLPENLPRSADLHEPISAQQGTNDFGSSHSGYRGPLPPEGSGPHRYFFKIYALDRRLDLTPAGVTKASLLAAMDGHILAQGETMGSFER